MSIWQDNKRRLALRALLFPVRVFVLVLLLASARTGLASNVFVEGFTDLPLMRGSSKYQMPLWHSTLRAGGS